MYSVTKLVTFCYGHRLLNYSGKCRYLHGHNGRLEIELSSERLDPRGMVRDFEEIKRTIQQWIDMTLDHAMLLRKDDPLVGVLRKQKQRLFLMGDNPTAETIARIIFTHIQNLGFPVTSVRLWETDSSFATYRNSSPRTKTSRLRRLPFSGLERSPRRRIRSVATPVS